MMRALRARGRGSPGARVLLLGIVIEVAFACMAVEYLFGVDGQLGLRPSRDEEGGMVLSVDPFLPKAPKLSAVLEVLMRWREMLEAGGISQAEYDAWRIGSEP